MTRKILGAALCASLLAGCGGGSSALPSSVAAPGTPHTVTTASAHIVISIPPAIQTTAKPAYVSPATQSVTVQIDTGTPVTQNLAPGSSNCTNAGANYPLNCTVTVTASAGAHTVTFATYDQQNGAGKLLSSNSIGVTFTAGQNPAIPVVLAGVPASIDLQPAPSSTTIAKNDPLISSPGIQFTWGTPQQIIVTALDADGNYIAGPGAPTFTFSTTNSDGTPSVTVTAASSATPNLFTLQSASPGYGTLTVTATPASTLAGSPLTSTMNFASVAASVPLYYDSTGNNFGFGLGLTLDSADGNLYAETKAGAFCGIMKITPAGTATQVAGASTCGFADGTGAAAALYYGSTGNSGQNGTPTGNLTYDSTDGNLYLSDTDNCAIRQVTPSGVVTTIAGSAPPTTTCYGYANGTGTAAQFYNPGSIVYVASLGVLFGTDFCTIREITTSGTVTTIAGPQPPTRTCGFQDSTDGTGGTARMQFQDGGVAGMALDTRDGNIYFSDAYNCVIRQMNPVTGNVVTIAGTHPSGRSIGVPKNCGYLDGVGTAAKFSFPGAITYDQDDGDLYVIDANNSAVRQIDPATGTVITIAGPPPGSTTVPFATIPPAPALGNGTVINGTYGIVYDHATLSLYLTQFDGVLRLQL